MWKCILEGPKIFKFPSKLEIQILIEKNLSFSILKTNKNTLLNQTGDSRARYQVRICVHILQLRGVSTRQNTLYSRQRKGRAVETHKSGQRLAGLCEENDEQRPRKKLAKQSMVLPHSSPAWLKQTPHPNVCLILAEDAGTEHSRAGCIIRWLPNKSPSDFQTNVLQAITEIQDTCKKKSPST